MIEITINNRRFLRMLLSAGLITGALTSCGGSSGGSVADVTVSPVDGATGVEYSAVITATFKNEVLASSIDGASFSLTNSNLSGSAVAGTVSFDAVGNVATFAPTDELSMLVSYNASLTSSITDLSGSALAALNWNFTTRDGVWGTEEKIESDDVGGALAPQVAIDANGNALAVWYQTDGTVQNIWSNRYTAGSGWGVAELIENDDAGEAVEPQIAFDPDGNALAVWRQSDGTVFSIWSNRYVVGVGWDKNAAVKIEIDDAGSAFSPQIAADVNGNALAVWYQSNGMIHSIWSNRYTAGVGWGIAKTIEDDNVGDAFDPQVAVDANGNAFAVWYQSDGTAHKIWANRYTMGADWGIAKLIESDTIGHAFSPQVSIDINGNALAVWRQSDGAFFNIWSNRYTIGADWGVAEQIGTGGRGEDAFAPHLDFDINGNALVVWSQRGDDTFSSIWSNRYTAGTGWGTGEKIESNNTGTTERPQVTVDANGNALAVWAQSNGVRYSIWFNRYAFGSGWGTPETIESGNLGDAFAVQVAIDVNSNALAVWRQSDGTRSNILSNRFE